MSSSNPIGGYFELELRRGELPHSDAVLLNSGRNCLEYILRTKQPKRVYIPKFTCDVMLEPLDKLKIPYILYSVNERLEIKEEIEPKGDELLVYTNYFGIKTDVCYELSQKYGWRLILDYSQAFFAERPAGSHVFYSPRKFFGLPDGGMLYTDQELEERLPVAKSSSHFGHLLKRIEDGAEAGYGDFKTDDQALSNLPLMAMSKLTQRLMANIDYEASKSRRDRNLAVLDRVIGQKNKLTLKAPAVGLLCYPFLSDDSSLRHKLIEHKIFVPTYWPNVLEWTKETELEHQLADKLLPLPIDQRYDQDDMSKIAKLILEDN